MKAESRANVINYEDVKAEKTQKIKVTIDAIVKRPPFFVENSKELTALWYELASDYNLQERSRSYLVSYCEIYEDCKRLRTAARREKDNKLSLELSKEVRQLRTQLGTVVKNMEMSLSRNI